MEDQKKLRVVIVIGFLLLSLMIAGVVSIFFNLGKPSDEVITPEQTSYIDPVSGETIIETEGKTPENFKENPNTPLVLGLNDFLDRGMTEEAIENIYASFTDYANERIANKEEKITQISIDPDTITHEIDNRPNVSREVFTARLVLNRQNEYFLKVTIDNVTSLMKIDIYSGKDSSGTPEFSSQKNL